MGSIISLKTKQQVLEMFKSGLRSRKISENLDLDRSVVKEWQYLYDGGDTRWVSEKPIARAKLVSQTQRAFIVNAYQMDALTMADLCRGFLLPKTVIKYCEKKEKRQNDFLYLSRNICAQRIVYKTISAHFC